jgi:protein phosphatase
MATDQRDSTRAEWRAAVSRPLDAPAFHPVSANIGLEVAGVSVCGKTQLQNTDHFVAIRLGRMQETLTTSLAEADLPPRFEEYAYAMLVADGLDSDGGGRASRFALSTLAHLAIRYGKWNVRIGPDTPSDVIAQGEFLYRQLTDAVIHASRADAGLAGMATSLTALYVAGADLFFAHVGHSRAYLFRNGVLIQLTMDHTLERLISASAALRRVRLEARRPPGTEPSAPDAPRAVPDALASRGNGTEIAIEHVQLWPADRLLLCTNGLTDYVREDQIADVLAGQRKPADDAQRLVNVALERGATDSVTVLLGDYWVHAEAANAPPPDLR